MALPLRRSVRPQEPIRRASAVSILPGRRMETRSLTCPGVCRNLREGIPKGEPVSVLDPDVYGAGGSFLVHDELRYCFALEVPRPGDVVGVGVGVDYVCRP